MLLKEQNNNNSKISYSQPPQQCIENLSRLPQQASSTNLLRRGMVRSGSLLQRDVLHLQRTIGNQAVTKFLARKQGLDNRIGPGVIQRGFLGELIDSALGFDRTFDMAVLTNISVASSIDIPQRWIEVLFEYGYGTQANGQGKKDFHRVIMDGWFRSAKFYRGGWILDIVQDAAAMTLDRSIFARGSLNLTTFVHELVHVAQYDDLGRLGFLASFFNLSAATILKRLMNREPLNIMDSSPHEHEAYMLEERFRTWYINRYGQDPEEITI